MVSESGDNAICCDKRYGPLFGSGHEICIGGDCNAKVDINRKDYTLNRSTFKCDLTDNLSGSKTGEGSSGDAAYLFQVTDYVQ